VRTQEKWLSAVTLIFKPARARGGACICHGQCPLSLPELGSYNAAEADMAHAGVDRLRVARRWAIAPAVFGAQRCDPPLTTLRGMRTDGLHAS